MISRVLSLAVLCLLLHIATPAYGQTDCLSLKGNVELILSIGPWQSQHLAILTTDLMLFKVKITQESLDAATVRLELDTPSSLATLEPKLNDLVHQLVDQAGVPFQLSPSDNLIQVFSPGALQRLILLSRESHSVWVINPLNGVQKKIPTVDFLSDATWLSSDSPQFYALNSNWIQEGTYDGSKPHVDVDPTVRYWETGDGDTLKVVDQPTRDAPNWKVKKAFHWQGNFYLLTPETVYVFEDILLSRKSVHLFKVPYEQFFICPEAKEATKNGSGKETKEETSKGKVTRAHWVHPSSTVAQHVNVVAWVLGLLCLFCLFAGFVGALLYYFLIYSKKESLQGRVLSSGSVSFNGGLVHIHSKTGEPKVKVPRSPKASPTKVKMASSKGPTASQLPGGLRVPTKVNVDVAKKQAAAKLALKRASTGALKVKREKSKVQSASATKSK